MPNKRPLLPEPVNPFEEERHGKWLAEHGIHVDPTIPYEQRVHVERGHAEAERVKAQRARQNAPRQAPASRNGPGMPGSHHSLSPTALGSAADRGRSGGNSSAQRLRSQLIDVGVWIWEYRFPNALVLFLAIALARSLFGASGDSEEGVRGTIVPPNEASRVLYSAAPSGLLVRISLSRMVRSLAAWIAEMRFERRVDASETAGRSCSLLASTGTSAGHGCRPHRHVVSSDFSALRREGSDWALRRSREANRRADRSRARRLRHADGKSLDQRSKLKVTRSR